MSITNNYKNFSDAAFEKLVIEEKNPTILLFGASWSGNSEMMDSMMERISGEFDENIQFFKVDIEAQEEVSHFFGVDSVPTTIILKDGEVKEFIKGFLPAGKMRAKIANTFDS